MPLLTPESSASSRSEDVLIMRANESSYHSEGSDISGTRMKEKILILGPFPSQTIELSSTGSPSSQGRYRTISPIPVPIPSYDDCFAAPTGSGIFNQLEYESSDIDDEDPDNVMMINVPGKAALSRTPSVSPPVCDWTPWVDSANEHRNTVQTRLEEMDDLMASVHSDNDLPQKGLENSPKILPSRLSVKAHSDEPFIIGADTGIFLPRLPSDSKVAPFRKSAYKIPQLRDLMICDDLPEECESHCHACHDLVAPTSMKRVIPCQDIICRRCFSAALGAVSEGQPMSRCPACLRPMTAFTKLDHRTKHSLPQAEMGTDGSTALPGRPEPDGPIVMRIDNVAWDLTPEAARSFLPENTLADIPVPIHIPLDRYDGRTKDYMYIEVASREAGRLILQTCQNAPMPGGPLTMGRKRAVTITQVQLSELLKELRPHSSSELQALLSLCQASVSDIQSASNHPTTFVPPNGIAHFVKNRHGPFNALMSIISKVKGKDSPIYWDLFHITSGAIAALGSHISKSSDPAIIAQESNTDPDKMILKKLTGMFESVFGIKLESGRLSPV